MPAHIRSLIYGFALLQVIWPCQAAPVSGRKAAAKASEKLEILEGWLTLGSAASSSSHPASQLPPIPFHQSINHPLQPSHSQSGTLSSEIRYHTNNKRITLRTDGLQKEEKDAMTISLERAKARGYGIEKKLERYEWDRLNPALSPPIRLLSDAEMYEIGIIPRGSRYKVVEYLENKKLNKGKNPMDTSKARNRNQRGSEVPFVSKRLLPLTKKVHSGKFMLMKKQAELNQLLQDEGILTTSDRTNRPDSQFYKTRTDRD